MDYLIVWNIMDEGRGLTLSAKGLVGTGFASRYRLQPRAGFKGPMGR